MTNTSGRSTGGAARPWLGWLLALGGMVLLGVLVGGLLAAQGRVGAAVAVAGAWSLATGAWLGYGVWRWRSYPWVVRLGGLAGTTLAAAMASMCLWTMGSQAYAVAVAGAWAMVLAFLGLLTGVRWLLMPSHPVLAVARTLLDEALRMRVALVFVVLLVSWVPMIPATQSQRELLNYRVQQFLSWSLSGTEMFLGLMTVFLACATVCNEVAQRQIFLTLTKPVSRGQYLLGKWLGIGLLNALLLLTAAGAVYVLTMAMARQPLPEFPSAADLDARARLVSEVLIARRTVPPGPPEAGYLDGMVESRIRQIRQEQGLPMPGGMDGPAGGFSGDPSGGGDAPGGGGGGGGVSDREREEAMKWVRGQWWHVLAPPVGGGSTGMVTQRYLFAGLAEAKQSAASVQLRLKPKAGRTPGNGKVLLGLTLNRVPFPIVDGRPMPLDLSDNTVAVVHVPTEAIDARGELEVSLTNLQREEPTSISFAPGEGLQLLYPTGSFEGNLARGVLVAWIKLAFLAMVGVVAGTFLGFPVACLLTMLVYLIGISNEFLIESLKYFAAFANKEQPLWDAIVDGVGFFLKSVSEGKIADALKAPVWLVGHVSRFLVPSFAAYDIAEPVSEGREIAWSMVGAAAGRIGVLSTGLVALAGWMIFRKKEIGG